MKKFLISIIVLLSLVIVAEVGFLVYRDYIADSPEPTTVPTRETAATTAATTAAAEAPTTVPTTVVTEAPTTVPTTVATEAPTTVPTTAATEAPTEIPTEAPTEAPTEPPVTTYLLSFAGNCTLGSTPSDAKNAASFISTVGEDYSFPFKNVASYFQTDEFTMVNLEGVLADEGTPIGKEFTFRGPAAYAKILTEGKIEAVSLANDHTGDFGTAGYKATKESLEAEGVAYVEDDKTLLYTTKNGLKIGVCAINGIYYGADMRQNIKDLKSQGADIIVAYFHWGSTNDYYPNNTQIKYAHTAVDLGADIVIGSNPHVLQKIENYKDSYICYSLGNFSYGGTKWPKDLDTAFVQLEVIRDQEGNVSLGELFVVPCCMTSDSGRNNFQPTILDAGHWQYNQILRKLSDNDGDGESNTQATTGTTAATTPTQTPTVAPTEPSTEATTEATTGSTSGTTPDVPDLYDPQP